MTYHPNALSFPEKSSKLLGKEHCTLSVQKKILYWASQEKCALLKSKLEVFRSLGSLLLEHSRLQRYRRGLEEECAGRAWLEKPAMPLCADFLADSHLDCTVFVPYRAFQ